MLARICCVLALVIASSAGFAEEAKPYIGIWYIDCYQSVRPDRCLIHESVGEEGSMVTATVTFNVYREPEIELRLPPTAAAGVIALGFTASEVQPMGVECDAKECVTSFRIGKGWITQLLAHDKLWIGYRVSDTDRVWVSLEVQGLGKAIEYVLGAKT